MNINYRVKETERGETEGEYRENEKGRVRDTNGESDRQTDKWRVRQNSRWFFDYLPFQNLNFALKLKSVSHHDAINCATK